MNSGIYKLYWKNTDHFYYGQSNDVHKRYKWHLRAARKGYHDNSRLIETFKQFGAPSLEVMEFCEVEQLNTREQYYITLFFGNPMCCNLSPTAGSQKGIKRTLETRQKISQSRSGKLLSDAHKKSISDGLYRRTQNGYIHKGLSGELNHFFGRTHTEETKMKMRGRKGAGGGRNGRARLVVHLTTGIFYDCALDAANAYGLTVENLRKWLNGTRKNKSGLQYV